MRIKICLPKLKLTTCAFILILCSLFLGSSLSAQISVTRLNNDQPIIYRRMPATSGNINGPSLIRISIPGMRIWEGDTIDKQKTVVATSEYGLDFNNGLQDLVVCPFYTRIFEYNNALYALTKEGVHKTDDLYAPWKHSETFSNVNPHLWKKVSNPFSAVPNEERHLAMLEECDTLHVMYSRYPSSPEHIEYSKIELKPWEILWKAEQPVDILYPELDWEGVNYPIQESEAGLDKEVHELRDPDLFKDADGQVYLLYTGAGENAIGIARVDGLLTPRITPCSCGSGCSESIHLFPNPVTGDFITISGIDKAAIIEVYSISGQKMISKHLDGTERHQLDISCIPKGIKFVSIQDELGVCWYQVVVL